MFHYSFNKIKFKMSNSSFMRFVNERISNARNDYKLRCLKKSINN